MSQIDPFVRMRGGKPDHVQGGFLRAKGLLVAEMPDSIKEMLSHYVQLKRPSVGASEAWAEVFAVTNGGGRNRVYTDAVLKYFPRTVEKVTASLAKIPQAKTDVPAQVNFHDS